MLPFELIEDTLFDQNSNLIGHITSRLCQNNSINMDRDILLKQQYEALDNIQEAQITQKEKYNKNIKINKLKIGDKVL
ncbi:936_t:CDS:2, partial [Scutellospora calospora]